MPAVRLGWNPLRDRVGYPRKGLPARRKSRERAAGILPLPLTLGLQRSRSENGAPGLIHLFKSDYTCCVQKMQGLFQLFPNYTEVIFAAAVFSISQGASRAVFLAFHFAPSPLLYRGQCVEFFKFSLHCPKKDAAPAYASMAVDGDSSALDYFASLIYAFSPDYTENDIWKLLNRLVGGESPITQNGVQYTLSFESSGAFLFVSVL